MDTGQVTEDGAVLPHPFCYHSWVPIQLPPTLPALLSQRLIIASSQWTQQLVPHAPLHRDSSLTREVQATKSQLQAQLKGMVAAEAELTEHLRATHTQIDEQLQLLRAQLKVGQSWMIRVYVSTLWVSVWVL